jgi:hypothetical protein
MMGMGGENNVLVNTQGLSLELKTVMSLKGLCALCDG